MKKTILPVFIFLLIYISFFSSCKRNIDPTIEITIGNYERESRDGASRGIIIEEISQNISYSKDSNVVMVYFFSNLSDNENFDYLKEGLIDYIINISRIGNLEYVDISTLWSKLKLRNISNPESLSIASVLRIANELNVRYLLTGNFRTSYDEIIISATLRRVEDGFILTESVQRGEFIKLFEIMNNLTAEIFTDIDHFPALDEHSEFITYIDTENTEAYNHYLQGLHYHKNYKINEAYNEFKKAIEMDKYFGSAHIRLISASNLPALREKNIQNALENKNNFSKINQLLLDFLILDKDKYTEEALELAIKIDHFNEDIRDPDISYLLFSNYYYNQMEIMDQIEYLKIIINNHPFYERAYNHLGYLLAVIGDYENAIKYLNQYSILLPDSPNPHDSLGDIYRLLGQYEMARQEYKKALALDKSFFFSFMNLLTIYEMDYKHHKAVEFTNDFFKRFTEEGYQSIDKIISLSTAYLLFSHKTIEYIDYRILSSYIIYLLRNGFIDDAIDTIERWYNTVSSKGDLTRIISEYPHEFHLHFGQPVLIKYYIKDDFPGYIDFLKHLRPLLNDQSFISLNNFIRFYYSDQDWFDHTMDYFKFSEEARETHHSQIHKLAYLYQNEKLSEAEKLLEEYDTLQLFEPSGFLFYAMQIDLANGNTSRIWLYEWYINRVMNNFNHYHLFSGMLMELKGNHEESLNIYRNLYNYLMKNNPNGHKDVNTGILRKRIQLLENK